MKQIFNFHLIKSIWFVKFSSRDFLLQFNSYFRTWISTWFIIIILFSVMRSIIPITIVTNLPPIDVVGTLANKSPRSENLSTVIIPLFEDVYLRNQIHYLNRIDYVTIIVQPSIKLARGLSLCLTEGFYNFNSASVELPKNFIQTTLIENFNSNLSHSNLLLHTTELMKLVRLSGSNFAYDLFKLRVLCDLGYYGLAGTSSVSLLCFGLYFSKLKIQIPLLILFSFLTFAGTILSGYTITIVLIIWLKNKSTILLFDLIVLLCSAIIYLYSLLFSIICLSDLLSFQTKEVTKIQPVPGKSTSTESFNFQQIANNYSESKSYSSLDLKQNSFQNQKLLARPDFAFPLEKIYPKSSNFEEYRGRKHNPFRNLTAPTRLGIQVIESSNSDLFNPDSKGFTSRFTEDIQ